MNTKLIIAILFVSILAVSCKKSDDDSSTPSNAAVTYNDGTDVTVDSINAVLYTLGVPPFNREIDVYAYKGGDQVLEFHFLPKTGALNVSQSFSDAWLTYLTNDGAAFPDDYFHCTSGNFNLYIQLITPIQIFFKPQRSLRFAQGSQRAFTLK
jgi:hypothetical protein